MERRYFLGALVGSVAASQSGWARSMTAHKAKSYQAFCASVRRDALEQGVASQILDEAFACTRQPNQKVLKRDRHQPEFTLSWSQYRARVVRDERCQQGQRLYQDMRQNMDSICQRFGCNSAAVMGIWGLESGFGASQGSFNVIDALATLGFDGRRAAFFRQELIKALIILGQGQIAPARMLGSYAGAMGQVQFMPSAYLRFAADGNGDGRKDIWNTQADIFASAANYLAKSGWVFGEPWGEEVTVPLGETLNDGSKGASTSRHAPQHTVADWVSAGVRGLNGRALEPSQRLAKLVQPDGSGGQAFLVYRNFRVLRAYNPSDYYALAVGLLGDRCTV